MAKVTIDSQWHGKEVKIQGKRVTGKSAFQIGLVVEGQAKQLAPVDYGRLAASYTTQAFDHGTAPENPSKYGKGLGRARGAGGKFVAQVIPTIARPTDQNEVLVGTAVDYAPHVEFGTVKKEARPHLRPALDLAMGKTLTIVKTNARYEFQDYLRAS